MKPICSPEDMYADIKEAGIIPFFRNKLQGFSIEELTPREHWFDSSDELGPWDWKIYSVQSGDIAYGKFLWGGKAAFATVAFYRELANWRRSLKAYRPSPEGEKVLEFIRGNGSCSTGDVRRLLGLKKNAADALLTRLEAQTKIVIGDFERVYRGEDLHYSGWQRAAFCTPEDLFGEDALRTSRSPEESFNFLSERIRSLVPSASAKDLAKLLG